MTKYTYLQHIRKIRAHSAFSLLSLIATLISCNDDEPGRARIDTGMLSASNTEVIIEDDKPTEEAVTFFWNAEKTPTIQYELVLTAGAQSDTVDVSSETSKQFVHAELNYILTDKLALKIGKPATIEVAVYAKSMNNTGSSNTITLSVTPSTRVDDPPLESLTLMASRPEAAINMANPDGETVSFSWSEEKNALIKYSLILTSGAKTATINVSSDVGKEFTNTELNSILLGNLGLPIGEPSNVDVAVQAQTIISGKTATSEAVRVSVTPSTKNIADPAYTTLWIVGNATPNGWDIDNPNIMINDPTNIYQFKYNEVLNAGEFKIPVRTGDWNGGYYLPLVHHQPLSETGIKHISGGSPDDKWKIQDGEDGAYKILLNISSTPFIKITKFTPYEQLYILGDATPAGWDADNPIAMTVDQDDPNIFTWTGELKSTGRGQFRFLLAPGELNGNSFVAPTSGAALTETRLAFTTDGIPGNNFMVKEGEDGTYKVTVNQLYETISIVKQ